MDLHISNVSASAIDYQNDDAIYWPEIKNGKPLTPKELLDSLPEIAERGQPIVTVSEHVLLWVMAQVRHGLFQSDDVNIWYHSGSKPPLKLSLEENGDLNQEMPGGCYPERLQLLM